MGLKLDGALKWLDITENLRKFINSKFCYTLAKYLRQPNRHPKKNFNVSR